MWSLLRSARHLPRYRRIVATLARHGLGWLVQRAGLSPLLSWPRRLFRLPLPPEPPPLAAIAARLCRALEELGPLYLLLGRYLSTRWDLLPADLCREIGRLLPQGPPPLPLEEVQRILEEEWGRPVGDLLASIEPTPWQRTWLEQVHRARTTSGDAVLVAVPDRRARAAVEEERPVLQDLARLIEEGRLPGIGEQASALVRAFDGELRQQLDARERGRAAERWQALPAGQGPRIPAVLWEYTTARVLVCQDLSGPVLGEMAVGKGRRPALARGLARFLGQAIFVEGLYPLPPDLGRPVLRPDGRLALTAFAPAGHLDRSLRRGVALLLRYLSEERLDRVMTTGISLGLFERRPASPRLRQALRHLVDRYADLPPAEMRLGELAGEIVDLHRRHLLSLPEDLALLLRTLAAAEDLLGRLAPQVSLAEELAPIVRRRIAALRSPRAWEERLLRAGQSLLDALGDLPATTRHLLQQAQEGGLRIGVEPRSWEEPVERLKRMVHRLVLSTVAAGLLVALALLSTALLPPEQPWAWLPVGLAALGLAVLGLLLLWTWVRQD